MMREASDRSTSIVATLGPASDSAATIEALILAGMDIVRLSLSSGTRDWHAETAGTVREIADKLERPVQLMADLQGRKNRLGGLPGGRSVWREGETVVLTAAPDDTGAHRTWMTRPVDPQRVRPGISVLIDDGALVLTVTDVVGSELRCQVRAGGEVTTGRGVTIPGATSHPAGLTARDIDDLGFARTLGVEIVALSFACSPEDYTQLHALAPEATIIGKVEHPDAVADLENLAAAFDGLMVARGDLAVEIPFEDVPIVQHTVVEQCRTWGKQALIATQLLHSMRQNSLPTRAEVADIAAAVRCGAAGLVLTGETGFGRHPVLAVKTLRRVITRTERHIEAARRERPVN